MKSITIILNPNHDFSEERVSIRLVVPAPISPRDLVPPVLGHWYCDSTSRYIGCFVTGRSGHYHVRNGLPTKDVDHRGHAIRDREMWLPASGRKLIPPYAFFFDPFGIGGSLPAFTLSEFDLFAGRPDDWFGTGNIKFTTGAYALEKYQVHWEHA